MQFRLLGQVEIESSGRTLPLPRRRARSLLAILLLQLDRIVPVDRLAHLLWDDNPPPQARSNIHSHVSRLRAVLATAEDHPELEFVGDGYRIGVDPNTVDVHQFRRLLDQASSVGEAARRIDILREALDLWRGPALGNAASPWLRDRLCAGLEEQRQAATEELIATCVSAHQEREVLPILAQVTTAHPERERLTELHMRALSQAGRKVEALEVYARSRDYLRDELGLDPNPRLRELHQAILRDKLNPPSADRPSTAATSSSGPRQGAAGALPPSHQPRPAVVPEQLPSAVAGFTGRDAQLADLDALLSGRAGSPGAEAGTRPVVISAIGGTAGVGKTALAVYWARQVADRFPGGQLYVNLRGFSPGVAPMRPEEAIRIVFDALEVPPHRIPSGLDAQVGLYRSVLARRRVLILLDNARDAEQVRPLLPGAADCLVIVTSRSSLSSLVAADGARPLTLGLLTHAEAWELLAQRLGPSRLAEDADATDQIIAQCARLPLALALAAARAAARPELPLRQLARGLHEARARLDALSDPDPTVDVRTAIDVSYRGLSTGAACLFRLLAVHPGPDASAPAAASLAAISIEQARAGLAELARAHLVEERSPDRYTYHDLLRAYAADLVRSADSRHHARAALQRALDYYLHMSVVAGALLSPFRSPITPPAPHAGVTLSALSDSEQAATWFAAERPVLWNAIAESASAGFDTHAWQLAWALSTFLGIRGLWRDQLASQQIALAAANRLGDPTAQAHAHRLLGFAHLRLGEHDGARRHLTVALDLSQSQGDYTSQAEIHTCLCMMCAFESNHREAIDHAHHALDGYRAAGHRMGEAFTLNNLGYSYGLLGDYQLSLDYCQQALALDHEQADNPRGRAATWDSCGFAHHHLGDYRQAISCYGRALQLYGEAGDTGNQAEVLAHLGDTHHAAADHPAAREAWQRALAILESLDHPDVEKLRTKLDLVP